MSFLLQPKKLLPCRSRYRAFAHSSLLANSLLANTPRYSFAILLRFFLKLTSIVYLMPLPASLPGPSRLYLFKKASFLVTLAMSSKNGRNHRLSRDRKKSRKHGDNDFDEDDDENYATSRNEIGRGEDVERFAKPEEINHICTSLIATGEDASTNPSKKSSGVLLGESEIKSDSDMPVNYGNNSAYLLSVVLHFIMPYEML